MGKYEKFYKKMEKQKLIDLGLMKLDILVNPILHKYSYHSFTQVLLNLSKLKDQDKKSVKKILNKLDKANIYLVFLRAAAYFACPEKNFAEFLTDYNLETILLSFKETGLVKDISFKGNGLFELILPDGRYVFLSMIYNSQKVLDDISNQCHDFSDYMLSSSYYKDNLDVCICTGKIKDYFKHDMYHTIIVDNGIAYDYVNNIMMPLEDYIDIFSFQILNLQDSIIYRANMNRLSNDDIEYKNSQLSDALKVMLNKEMKNNKSKKIKILR